MEMGLNSSTHNMNVPGDFMRIYCPSLCEPPDCVSQAASISNNIQNARHRRLAVLVYCSSNLDTVKSLQNPVSRLNEANLAYPRVGLTPRQCSHCIRNSTKYGCEPSKQTRKFSRSDKTRSLFRGWPAVVHAPSLEKVDIEHKRIARTWQDTPILCRWLNWFRSTECEYGRLLIR